MRVAIHQPLYLPWLGYFHKMALCDLSIVLDTVQFQERLYQRRNRIKTPQGWMWLSVPVEGSSRQCINDVLINNTLPWKKKHWQSITLNYSRAPFSTEYLPGLIEIYQQDWGYLVDLDLAITCLLAKYLHITTPLVRASQLGIEGNASSLLASLCQKVGASTYLSGVSGRKYLQEDLFSDLGIAVEYQRFEHPVYPQQFGPFQPLMSAIDLLCNCGPAGAALISALSGEKRNSIAANA